MDARRIPYQHTHLHGQDAVRAEIPPDGGDVDAVVAREERRDPLRVRGLLQEVQLERLWMGGWDRIELFSDRVPRGASSPARRPTLTMDSSNSGSSHVYSQSLNSVPTIVASVRIVHMSPRVWLSSRGYCTCTQGMCARRDNGRGQSGYGCIRRKPFSCM